MFLTYHALGTQRPLAWTSLHLAEAARQQEKYEVAHACYRKSLELFERLNETEGMASVLCSWGQLAARQHKLQWARLWGASQVWNQRKTSQHFSLPVDHLQPTGANNEPVVAAVRQQLGPQAFTAAREEGQGMSLPHASSLRRPCTKLLLLNHQRHCVEKLDHLT